MNNLDQIKQALFTATGITDALTKLDALGVAYRECAVCDETYHLLQEDVTFWAPRSKRVTTIHVCIGDVIATLDYRQQFFAQQQPDLSKSVPAHDSLAVVEQPVSPDLLLVVLAQTLKTSQGSALLEQPLFDPVSFQLGARCFARTMAFHLRYQIPELFIGGSA